ncbi:MAG: DUF992 domain-containing protein [Zetaproteobacteria bacterium]|nr:MAG: DUF992 domain-containing protein [Zetaproteobacteria bacterium]
MKRKMKRISLLSAVLLGMLGASGITTSQAAEEVSSAGTKVGVLTCKRVEGSGVNLIIHSTADIKCTFESTAGGSKEHYKGETGVGLGVDLNFKKNETMVFAVFSADFKPGTYQLAGKYGGAGASAAAGVGVGAQVLLGGNNRSISLQPIALSGSTGVGAAAGITYLYLEPDKD